MGEARGEVELEGHVLIIKRIHVRYRGLRFDESQRATVERALAVHAAGCPVSRSVEGAIAITTSLAESS